MKTALAGVALAFLLATTPASAATIPLSLAYAGAFVGSIEDLGPPDITLYVLEGVVGDLYVRMFREIGGETPSWA